MRRSADLLLRVYRSNDFLAVSFQSTFKPRRVRGFLSLPPPALCERCHRGLTALGIAVRRRAFLVARWCAPCRWRGRRRRGKSWFVRRRRSTAPARGRSGSLLPFLVAAATSPSQADAGYVAAHQHSKAVALNLVQPFAAWGQFTGFGWEPRRDEPGREDTLQHCGAWIKKDAAESISSTREKYEANKKEPRAGDARGSGRQKAARGSSRAILRRLIQHFDETATLSQTVRGIFRRSGINICFYTPLREKFFGRYGKFFGRLEKIFWTPQTERDAGYAPRYK